MQLHIEGPTLNRYILMPVLLGISKRQKSSMFSRNTKSIADIGERLMNGVIGRNGNDNSTGEECVMRAMIIEGVVTMITDCIHFIE